MRSHITDKDKIKEILSNYDPTGAGEIPYETLRQVVRQFVGNHLNEHELMTIGRYYGDVKVRLYCPLVANVII